MRRKSIAKVPNRAPAEARRYRAERSPTQDITRSATRGDCFHAHNATITLLRFGRSLFYICHLVSRTCD
ncbi:hypothetical protein RSOLAG1IB_08268 [Rhizoctonia solani AG-1 IB]|uniref:Uncharacterized protein n=1 Tax=Thanatephorus cucumeris (strain AG1-IB / isolate 7/3/14) TaxID=1108050 RepID=A0A0B7FHA4_THACB|nr:hypothetical protein RSOLAG1IB_08268 [Rhizoctonia solani AG-1 IB]